MAIDVLVTSPLHPYSHTANKCERVIVWKMSCSVESIDRLRYRVREMERKIRLSEQIRKKLVVECEVMAGSMSESGMKDEILAAWLNGFDANVQRGYQGESGDDGWGEVVGDVMDEMRQRAAQSRTHKTDENAEIDLRSVLGIVNDDVENLGQLCAELLTEFFPEQVIVEKEKSQRRLESGSVSVSEKGKEQPEMEKMTIDEENQKGEHADVGKMKNPEGDCRQITGTGNSMGEMTEMKSKDEETDEQSHPEIGNYLQFVVVDEKNRPLGSERMAGDQEQTPVPTPAPNTERESRTVSPANSSHTARGYDSEMENISGESTHSTGGPIVWVNVVSNIVDQNTNNENGVGIWMDQVYDMVSMFIPGPSSDSENGSGQSGGSSL